MGTMVFDPAEVGTWPEVLTQPQAKAVVLAAAADDKTLARQFWSTVGVWESWPAADMEQWVGQVAP
jgi:hypothetical protein